jgi:branched-chain amino acid transport system permease protein
MAVEPPTSEVRPAGAEVEDEARAILAESETSARRRDENRFAATLKDSFLGAVVALAMFAPIVGLQTVPGMNYSLTVFPRWGMVAVMVAIVFFGRLLLNLFVWKSDYPVTRVAANLFAAIPRPRGGGKLASPLLLLLAIGIPIYTIYLAPDQSRYIIGVGTLILTYVMLGWGLNIVVGLAGLLDLGYVAFYAVGAYSYAIISAYFGLSFWVCLPLAGIFAALWGVILGFPVLRLRGDYLAIVTLAFGEIIRLVLINWVELTNGPNGINQIARPSFFGLEFTRNPDGFAAFFGIPYSTDHRIVFLYYLILALALVTNFVVIRIRNLPIGRAWEALREDEIACRSLGINTTNTKLTAFAMGAMFGGFAGSFFAARQGFVSPESFVFLESAIILAIVVLGGMGSLVGIAVAAMVMIGGTEALRELDFLKQIFGPDFTPELYRMLLFGMAMVIVMLWKPRGFVGSREPTAFLKVRRAVSGSFTKEGHG